MVSGRTNRRNKSRSPEKRSRKQEEEPCSSNAAGQFKTNFSRTSTFTIPPPKPLSLVGNVRENLRFYEKVWSNYCKASKLDREEEEVQKAHLLSIIGDDALKIYLKVANDRDILSPQEVLEVLKLYLVPTVNVRYERFIFNSTKQNENEIYSDYIIRLKGLINTCDYGEMEEELFLDKIICSVKDQRLQESLWLKREITLSQAMEMCRARELAEEQIRQVNPGLNEINELERNIKGRESKKLNKCQFCGSEHRPRQCPAYGSTCNYCGKKNHFAAVCFKKKKDLEVKQIDDSEESFDSVMTVTERKNKGIMIELNVFSEEEDMKKVTCQLDTGATCNVIGLSQLQNITGKRTPRLEKSHTRLKVFGGEIITPLGMKTLKVKHRGRVHYLQFQVVEYDHCALLSAEACKRLELIQVCYALENQAELENIMNKYKEVFTGLGKFEGEAEIEIVRDHNPVRMSPRRIPLALREDLKKEIEEMVANKVIVEETNYTDWVSNLLVVKKPSGKLRVCLDPSELNKAIKDTKQQLPTIDEILPELKAARVFSTVDAKQGFWQVKLSEESSKRTAFWTPFGKFRYLRLPFGISTAMEIFQKKMLETIAGLEGVFVIADDILIVGRGNNDSEAIQDHHKNFEDLLIRLRSKGIKLNKEKTTLCSKSVKFYGHILSAEGMKPNPDKISAILEMPRPTNKESVLRFLGMVTYLGRYVRDLSNILKPLREPGTSRRTVCMDE